MLNKGFLLSLLSWLLLSGYIPVAKSSDLLLITNVAQICTEKKLIGKQVKSSPPPGYACHHVLFCWLWMKEKVQSWLFKVHTKLNNLVQAYALSFVISLMQHLTLW